MQRAGQAARHQRHRRASDHVHQAHPQGTIGFHHLALRVQWRIGAFVLSKAAYPCILLLSSKPYDLACIESGQQGSDKVLEVG